MEERVYQGFVYRRAGPGQPWQQVGPAKRPVGQIIGDPSQAADERRKDTADRRAEEGQDLQRQQLGLSRQSNARSAAEERINNPQTLRKEYASLPEVKEYKVASQMAAAALNTADSPQGDISLTYAYAKAMDPGSVVRDQEQRTLSNSQPWFQSLVQNAKKQFGMDGAGRFTPEARQQIRAEVIRSLATRKTLYDTRRGEFADYAKTYGIAPYEVVGRDDTQSYAPQLRAYGEKAGDPEGVISAIVGGEPIQKVAPQAPSGPPMRAAGAGATEGAIPIPEGLQQAHSAYLAEHWGKIDPRDYAAFRINLDREYGFGSDPDAYMKSVEDLNKAAAMGQQPNAAYVPPVRQDLSGFDQFRNNLLSDQYGIGAGVASGLNAAAFGIPSLAAPAQMDALRTASPIATAIGDVGGAMAGTGLAGSALRGVAGRVGEKSVASLLANPLTADVAYGATYGATQADDPLYGAAGGAAAAFAGNRIGRAIGKTFPGAVGQGSAIRELDATVPGSEDLRKIASELYRAAEAKGLTATGDETFALADTTSGLLSREGRLSPTGRLTEVQPQVREAQNLIGDYAGQPMTPTQVQTVRSVISDGLGSKESAEQRIARLMLDNFDEWTDATNPALAAGLADARGVASRYLQGDKIAQARELADVRAGQFTNSGPGNALRTDFRQLDRAVTKGHERFSPSVEAAIADVARGTPVGNTLRNVGRFAPTGAVSSIPTLLAMGAGGSAAGTPGIAAALAAGGLAFGARQLGQKVTNRSAEVAQNLAYGGVPYEAELNALLEEAANRGGHGGAAVGSEVARALLGYVGY